LILPSKAMAVSGDKRFKPVRQLDEFELTGVLGAIKRVTHDDLAQFGSGVVG
jgi:hypothetical protein